MSQPKRYNLRLPQITYGMEESQDGEYVYHSDYAALAAENERLRSKLSFSQSISEICKLTHEGETITVQGSISSGKTILSSLCQCERLAAENKVLRKAGDMLFECIEPDIDDIGYNYGFKLKHAEARDAWLAAKEGRDAK